jgi:hypothetical protein
MRNNKFINAIAGVAILGACAAVYLAANELPPQTSAEPHQTLGAVMAREALTRLSPGGAINIIIRDTKTFPQPAMDIQVASFKKSVSRANANIASTLNLQIDPLRPFEVPSGDFFELIRRASQGSVIVSFMGPPLLAHDQRNQLTAIKPKVIAFCPGYVAELDDLRPLFEQGLLHAAIIPRRGASRAVSPTAGASESFDQLYEVVTSANLTDLPPSTPGQ